jgi:hypothetical protein
VPPNGGGGGGQSKNRGYRQAELPYSGSGAFYTHKVFNHDGFSTERHCWKCGKELRNMKKARRPPCLFQQKNKRKRLEIISKFIIPDIRREYKGFFKKQKFRCSAQVQTAIL